MIRRIIGHEAHTWRKKFRWGNWGVHRVCRRLRWADPGSISANKVWPSSAGTTASQRRPPRSWEIHWMSQTTSTFCGRLWVILHIKKCLQPWRRYGGKSIAQTCSNNQGPQKVAKDKIWCWKPRKSEPGLTEHHGKTVGYFLQSVWVILFFILADCDGATMACFVTRDDLIRQLAVHIEWTTPLIGTPLKNLWRVDFQQLLATTHCYRQRGRWHSKTDWDINRKPSRQREIWVDP